MVPAEALIPDFEATFVFVVEDGKAERRRCDRNPHDEPRADPFGARARRRVVTSGLPQLRPARRCSPSRLPTAAIGASMTLPEFSIRRPVLTIAVSLLAAIAGVVGLTRLPVREYPAIDPPTLSVSTSYPGAAAEIVEAQITEPLEAAINTVAGITSLRSHEPRGRQPISVEFSLDTDLEAAASDVRDQIARVGRQLPDDVDSADPQQVRRRLAADLRPRRSGATAARSSSSSAYADTLRERLQTVPGIAGVNQPAEKRYAMRLWIDTEKLRAYGLSPLDVRAAVNRENVELPSGRIEGESVELAVKTLSRLDTPEEFNALVIKRIGDRIVRFSDVGRAELGAQNDRGALKEGETPIAGLYFKPQAGANQIEIVDELRRRLDQIQREVPDDIKVEVAYDNTEYVRRSLLEVSETILIAFVLVVLVVFAFLREWRTTLIPVIAIPVSIVGAFGVMAAAGFSINTLTLLGIVLSIGLVVDDAIVVLENIYAKIEKRQGADRRRRSKARTRYSRRSSRPRSPSSSCSCRCCSWPACRAACSASSA